VTSGGASGDRRPTMSWWLVAFCWAVMWLNRIPRYGRLWRWIGADDLDLDFNDKTKWVKHWRWQRRGWWGVNLLNSMGLMWRYFDYRNPEPEDDDVD